MALDKDNLSPVQVRKTIVASALHRICLYVLAFPSQYTYQNKNKHLWLPSSITPILPVRNWVGRMYLANKM